MPPSTVFSYWRREHRRSSAPVFPAVQPTSKTVASSNNPPQLPVINDSTTLTTTFDESFTIRDGSAAHTPTHYFPDFDGGKAAVAVSTVDAASSSTTTLTVPPPSSSESKARPHSSPEERERELSLTAQSNSSQLSLSPLQPDQTSGDSSKPSSPFRRSFGKGLLTPQQTDNSSKRLSAPGMAPSSNLRFRPSPEQSPADKTSAAQKEYRYDSLHNRRYGDRDAPVEHVPHKSGKAMLHLLNPMSLLAKRRSSQIAGLRAEDMNIGARNLVPAIPDDYDPRIRGNIVHDFSAPRPRRHLSGAPVLLHASDNQQNPSDSPQHASQGNEANVRGSDSGGQTLQAPEQKRKQSDYSPVFKEHFEDDEKVLQIENKAYLQSSLLTDPSQRDNNPHAIPVFARKLPSTISGQANQPTDGCADPIQDPQFSPEGDKAPENVQDPDTIEIVPHQPSGLPKHFKSNASRFSFDMNGVESSQQEKLLEEKHKEKEAARRAQARLEDKDFSDVDDDYDNELLDDMDDFEERIPGVNVEADEEDEFSGFSGPGHILNKSWLAPDLSPVVASPVNPDVSGLQDTQLPSSGAEEAGGSPLDYSTALPVLDDPSIQGRATLPSYDPPQTPPGVSTGLSRLIEEEDEDDLYFDDGEFGELSAEDAGEKFDESIFDDETSHLYDRKRVTDSSASAQLDGDEHLTTFRDSISEYDEIDTEPGVNGGLKHVPSMASDYPEISSLRRYGSIAEDVPNPVSAKSHGGVLSEHNLEALHNALADAASQAASKGRFGHTTSVSERSIAQESTTSKTVDSHPGLVSDDSRLSQGVEIVAFEEVFDDFNYDDNYDPLYDDPIIAAANAEALENDDEGFYGQEFGFYACSNGAGSELTNGGYFGPRGVEGVSRSHSGRGKFREPSLTPITERSEWSTRNSIISVSAHGAAHSGQGVSSPGLAQLVGMGDLDDEMTLGALMRLRRGAWGGSNGSLRSGSGSPPPHPQPTSNRGSFTLSDISPTVHAMPPDFLGGTSAVDSPIRESDKGGGWPSYLSQQRIERSTGEDGDSQIQT